MLQINSDIIVYIIQDEYRLFTTRTNDSIQFANGDNLQLSLANINQPNNAGLATIQYSN
jgi:hypothetical protein